MSFFNIPIKLKFKKFHKTSTYSHQPELNFTNTSRSGSSVLKAIDCGRLTVNHLEAARKTLRRKLRKSGKIYSHVVPSVSITKKPLAVRMGKGKGPVEAWIAPIRTGRVLFEVSGVPLELGAEALLMASKKLPIATRVAVNKPILI